VILEDQLARRRADLHTRTQELKVLAKAIYGAAGSNEGIRASDQINLLPPIPGQPAAGPRLPTIGQLGRALEGGRG
jgi:hypothetical protein